MAPPQSNKQYERLGTLDFDAGGSDHVTVRPQAAPILGFLITISGTLANADTADGGTLNDFGVAKLLRNVILDFDGTDFVNARGDDLFTLQYIFKSADGPLLTRPTPGDATSDFEASILIPMMPQRVLGNAFPKVHWPGLAVPQSGFRLETRFEGGTANSNSDDGTGALLEGGTDEYSFNALDIEVHTVFNDMPRSAMTRPPQGNGNGRRVSKFPAYAPRIRTFSSSQIGQGSTPDDFTTPIPGKDALMLLHMRELVGSGTDQTVEDLVDNIRVAHDDDELPEVSKTAYRELIIDQYEGVGRSVDGADAPRGLTYMPFTGDGKLGGILPLSQLNDPTVEVDVVNGPTGDDGRLRFVKYGLVEIDGATAGQPVR